MSQVRVALRDARKAAGLTIAAAAQRAGYKSKSGWAMVEGGYNTPSVPQMKAMAAAVECKLADAFPEINS